MMRRGQSKSLRAGRLDIQGQIYHLRFSTRNRVCVFDFPNATVLAKIIVQGCELYEYGLLTWVIMPDHVHMLVQLDGYKGISQLVRSIKTQYTRASLQKTVWQDGYFDRAIRHEDDILEVARYIVSNPIRAGLVKSVREYSFWNSKWLN